LHQTHALSRHFSKTPLIYQAALCRLQNELNKSNYYILFEPNR
jgi:hypothetical protein